MFGNLGKLVAELYQFCRYTPVIFLEFSLISNVFIDIDGYENKLICIFNQYVKGQCLSINFVPILTCSLISS